MEVKIKVNLLHTTSLSNLYLNLSLNNSIKQYMVLISDGSSKIVLPSFNSVRIIVVSSLNKLTSA